MPKPISFTSRTSLPKHLPVNSILTLLHDHAFIIKLNPLVTSFEPIAAPPELVIKNAVFTDSRHPSDHNHVHDDGSRSSWYTITDQIPYLSGGGGNSHQDQHHQYLHQPSQAPAHENKRSSMTSYNVTYTASCLDLHNGVQTICHAPLGVTVRSRWTLGEDIAGEAFLREDVDLRCSALVVAFVKKTMMKAHAQLADRLLEKATAIIAEKQQSMQVNHPQLSGQQPDQRLRQQQHHIQQQQQQQQQEPPSAKQGQNIEQIGPSQQQHPLYQHVSVGGPQRSGYT